MSLTVEVNQTGVSVIQGADTSVTVSTVGTPGTNGAQGAPGPDGSQGAQGSPGNNGAQGAPGTNGSQGAQGSPGNNGAQGAQGSPGTQGAQGIQGLEGPKSGITSGSFGSGSYADQLGFTSIGEVYQWTETSVSAGRPYYVNNQHVGGGTSGFILYNNGYTNLFSGLTRDYWTFNGIPSQIAFAAIDANGVDRTAELEAATVLTIATDINNFVKYNVAHNGTFGSIFTNGTYNLVQFNIVGVVSQAGAPPALAAYETDPGNISLYLGAETIGGGGSSSTAWELISYITGSEGPTGAQGAQGAAGNNGTNGAQGAQGAPGNNGNNGAQGAQGASGEIPNTGSFATTGSNIFNGNQIISGSLDIATVGGDEGGELRLGKAVTNTTLTGSTVVVDIFRDRVRIFEDGGTNRGAFLNVVSQSANVNSQIVTSPNIFSIQTISSASYAALTPVSGTLYIIV